MTLELNTAPPKPAPLELQSGASLRAASCSPSRLHLDLFSGIGGFALAAQWTGWQTIAFAEIDTYATKILKRHWPTVPNLGDIRNVRNVRCDLITGGFPCQPFSVAGKRRGASDDRALWPEMCRVIEESRPRWVLGENVPGIIGLELDRVLSDLENLGYSAGSFAIPACALDGRHIRNRIWIVASAAQAHSNEMVADSNGGKCRDATENNHHGKLSGVSVRGGEQFVADKTWKPEPSLGRVADGIPNRAHRLKGLGNAIVPQVAATILSAMVRMENDGTQRRLPPPVSNDNTQNENGGGRSLE